MAPSTQINTLPGFGCVTKDEEQTACNEEESGLEDFFAPFRKNTIGGNQIFESPFGPQKILYADWTASGRAYKPIEDFLRKNIMPFIANTHTGTTVTGMRMSNAYDEAKGIVKHHVNAGSDDVLLFCGSGMTSAVNKLQRMLGMRIPEGILDYICIKKADEKTDTQLGVTEKKKILEKHLCIDEILRPVVFITHMEHHSNQLSWLETIATVEIIRPHVNGNVDLAHFKCLLQQYKHRKHKIAAVTACSNVTGIETPYHHIAKLVHGHGGLCFVDFACSAPYVDINMHPDEKGAHLDAVYFSMHKFLGGAGTPGVLVFNKRLYKNTVPDQPGGGTVLYSNPWGGREYVNDIEHREDGGTPPFLQAIKAAMCVRLKEEMGVEKILQREKELLHVVLGRLMAVKNIRVLEEGIAERLGVVSFVVQGTHYNLVVKLLNDRFGIQTRGGCSCAGTYGHYLLGVNEGRSREIWGGLKLGDFSGKPGWVRLSIHPTMTDEEIGFLMDAIELTANNVETWCKDYEYDAVANEYFFKGNEVED